MNKNLEQAVQAAIEQIKTLPSDKIQIIKAEFDKIHRNAISAEESWYNLVKDGFFQYRNGPLVSPFIILGGLVTFPSLGALNILSDAYAEDKTENIDFLYYQSQVKEEVWKLVCEI